METTIVAKRHYTWKDFIELATGRKKDSLIMQRHLENCDNCLRQTANAILIQGDVTDWHHAELRAEALDVAKIRWQTLRERVQRGLALDRRENDKKEA